MWGRGGKVTCLVVRLSNSTTDRCRVIKEKFSFLKILGHLRRTRMGEPGWEHQELGAGGLIGRRLVRFLR